MVSGFGEEREKVGDAMRGQGTESEGRRELGRKWIGTQDAHKQAIQECRVKRRCEC